MKFGYLGFGGICFFNDLFLQLIQKLFRQSAIGFQPVFFLKCLNGLPRSLPYDSALLFPGRYGNVHLFKQRIQFLRPGFALGIVHVKKLRIEHFYGFSIQLSGGREFMALLDFLDRLDGGFSDAFAADFINRNTQIQFFQRALKIDDVTLRNASYANV